MKSSAPMVVGFGRLTPAEILAVDPLPLRNGGAVTRGVSEFVFDDGAIVPCHLHARQPALNEDMIR